MLDSIAAGSGFTRPRRVANWSKRLLSKVVHIRFCSAPVSAADLSKSLSALFMWIQPSSVNVAESYQVKKGRRRHLLIRIMWNEYCS